jgi:hypothetical protein
MVFVKEPAEPVTSAHRTWLILADDLQASRWIRRPQRKRAVWAMGRAPAKSRFVPICPMPSGRGPTARDRVGPGREPGSSDRHVRAFGANCDFAGALGRWELSCSMETRRTCSRWPRPTIRRQSRHSARTVPTHPSAQALALGARGGVSSTCAPSATRPRRRTRERTSRHGHDGGGAAGVLDSPAGA